MSLTRRTFLGSAAALPLAARAAEAPLIPARDLQADAALFERIYRTMHPGLTRYNSPAGLDRLFGALQAAFVRDRSLGDAFLAFGRATAAVKCGHSYPNPNNQGKRVCEALLGNRDRLPLLFRWIGGRMIVTRDLTPGASLPPGSEILRIDGVRTRDMLRTLLPYARADGSNDAKRIANLEVGPAGRMAAFDVYRPLLWPTGAAVRIEARRPDGRTVTIDAPWLDEAARRGPDPLDRDPQLGWRLEIRNGVAVMTMPSWAAYNSKFDWQGWIDEAFARMSSEKVRGLVVDLRLNEGGNDCGNAIAARLIDAPLPLPAYPRFTRYRTTEADLNAALDTWDDGFRNWGAAAVGPDARGFYRLTRSDDDGGRIEPKGPRFRQPVAVLVGPENSSATFQFAMLMQQNRLARLIGEPTGGNRRGINGGAYFFVRLPNSRIEVDLPLIGYFPQTPQPDAGLRPDEFIPQTAAAIAAGRDLALETALQRMS